MKKYILDHRKIITAVMIIVPVIILLLVLLFSKFIWKNTNSEALEMVAYVSQILSSIFVIAGVLVAAWQYYITSRSEMEQICINQVQRAIDFSEYYKDNILHKFTPVRFVYEQSGILEVLKKLDKEKFKDFDTIELKNLISNSDIKELENIQTSNEFAKAVITSCLIYGLKLKVNSIKFKDDEDTTKEVGDGLMVTAFMRDEINALLNNLEYFAMNFTHGTADDSVVYQSLHQSYIEIVQTLYYNIASLNEPLQPKFFTNVTELYNKWYNKMQDQMNSMLKVSKFANCKGTMVEVKNT